jgi:hypothetical protein
MSRRLSVPLTEKEAEVLIAAGAFYELDLEDRTKTGASLGQEKRALNRALEKLVVALRGNE